MRLGSYILHRVFYTVRNEEKLAGADRGDPSALFAEYCLTKEEEENAVLGSALQAVDRSARASYARDHSNVRKAYILEKSVLGHRCPPTDKIRISDLDIF